MNEELKKTLKGQRTLVYGAMLRFRHAKTKLEGFDATARVAIRADGVKRTESDVDALVLADPKRAPLEAEYAEAEAELSAVKVDTDCLLANVSLVCSETAAMSRVAGQ
jgi:hypothetical protein